MNTENQQQEEQQDTSDTQESVAVPSERLDISAADLGDPDAKTDDDAGDAKEDEGEQGEDQGEESAEEGGAEQAEAAEDDGSGKKDPNRQAIDGLKGELIETRKEFRKARDRIEELERAEAERQAAAAKAASRDYDKELAELDDKYDSGEITDFKTYQQQREKIVVDRASEAAVSAYAERTMKEQAEKAQQAWASSVDAFLADEANAAFNDDPILANALSAAIQVEVANGVADHKTILENASKAVNDRFGRAGGGEATQTPEATTRAARKQQQAKATAAGAAAVPSPTSGGGAGMRSQGAGAGDLSESTGNNDWRSMSKAQQDEALGKPA